MSRRPRALAQAAILAAALAIAACGEVPTNPETRIDTRTVEVAVAQKCAADPGPDPAYADSPDALREAPDIFERVKLLLAGKAQRTARLLELAAANAGCR